MRTERQRAGWWWVVFVSACTAMAIFIAFEVLDLDGSDFKTGLPGGTVTAEARGAEFDRLLFFGIDVPISLGAERLPVASRFLLTSVSSVPTIRVRTRRIRAGTARTTVRADVSHRALSSHPADPF